MCVVLCNLRQPCLDVGILRQLVRLELARTVGHQEPLRLKPLGIHRQAWRLVRKCSLAVDSEGVKCSWGLERRGGGPKRNRLRCERVLRLPDWTWCRFGEGVLFVRLIRKTRFRPWNLADDLDLSRPVVDVDGSQGWVVLLRTDRHSVLDHDFALLLSKSELEAKLWAVFLVQCLTQVDQL